MLARQGWQQQINLLAAGILTRRAIFPRLTAQTRPGGKFNARKGGGAVQGEASAGEPPMKTDSLTDRPPRNRFGRAILTNMLEKIRCKDGGRGVHSTSFLLHPSLNPRLPG